jgi:hypothetical protein
LSIAAGAMTASLCAFDAGFGAGLIRVKRHLAANMSGNQDQKNLSNAENMSTQNAINNIFMLIFNIL